MSLVQTLKSDTTISSLIVQKTNPSDSGTYQCIPSNTGPAEINVHVLDGKYKDELYKYSKSIKLESHSLVKNKEGRREKIFVEFNYSQMHTSNH